MFKVYFLKKLLNSRYPLLLKHYNTFETITIKKQYTNKDKFKSSKIIHKMFSLVSSIYPIILQCITEITR